MMAVFLRIVITPLSYVTFADFWVADQLNSMQPIFPDMHYWYCFFTSLGTNGNSWYLATDDSVCRQPRYASLLSLSHQDIISPIYPSGWALFLGCLPAWFR